MHIEGWHRQEVRPKPGFKEAIMHVEDWHRENKGDQPRKRALRKVNLWSALASRKFAIWILIIILAVLIIHARLPQLQIAGSWWFLALNFFLLLSTISCTEQRIRSWFKARSAPPPPLPFKHQIEIPAEDYGALLEKAGQHFRSRGWRKLGSRTDIESDAPTGIKKLEFFKGGEPGFWGSIVFHSSFILLVLGIMVSSLTKWQGALLITEGETKPLSEESFIQVRQKPKFGTGLPQGIIRLEKMKTNFVKGIYGVNYEAVLNLITPEETFTDSTMINNPLLYKKAQFLLTKYGYAPLMVFRDSKGETVQSDYFNLRVVNNMEDSVSPASIPYVLRVKFFPDVARKGTTVFTRSQEVKNPAFGYQVFINKKGSVGKMVAAGAVEVGKPFKFGDYTVTVEDLRRWAFLEVSRDPGMPLVGWALVGAALGLMLRFLFPDKIIWVVVDKMESGTMIKVGGRCRFYPSLFRQEIEKFAERLTS